MSPSVLAALAGVFVAAASTGLLARQCIRRPQAGIVLWAAACTALTVALLAQIAGFASGFTPVTFRAVQLGALFAAPLWLAWGLIEVAPFSGTVRFGVRLASAAITVVGGVMIGSDPLTAAPFTKSWPSASAHFQFVANDALLLAQGVAVLVALTAAGAASLRARAGSNGGSSQEVPGYAAAAVAVLDAASLRFAFPANPVYPLVCGLTAALAWFAMTRVQGTRSELSAAARGQRARRYESDDPANVSREEPTMRGFRGRNRDDWDEPRRGRGRRDDEGWYQPGPDDRGYPGEGYQGRGYDDSGRGSASDARSAYQQPAYGGYEPNGYGQGGYGGRGSGQAGYAPGGYPQNGHGTDGYDGGGYGSGANGSGGYGAGADGGAGYGAAGYEGANGGAGYGPGGYGGAGYEGAGYERQNGAGYSGPPDGGTGYGRVAQPDVPASAMNPGQAPATVPAGRPYGRISIFTLLDDKAAEFDLLAEQTAEAVRVAEPDTLVYVIHLVPKAPMQRIFYEIYRDREAFELHERQPHNQRFAAERRPYVLATNIIELRLKYAKVAPLSPGVSSQKSQTPRYSQMPPTPQGQLPSPDPASRPPVPNRAQPSPTGQRYGG